MVDQPLVSIVIDNQNYGRFLGEAIDSALNQTYSHTETIVVDDGSEDNSREIIAGYGDRIIPVLKENGGQVSANKAGLAASSGSIICFLDSDDVFLPHKVDRIAEVFKEHPDIGSCFHPLQATDNTGMQLPSPGMVLTGKHDFRSSIRQGNMPPINTASSGLCFRRAVLELSFQLPETDHITGDYYPKFTALALQPTFYFDERLAVRRIHDDNWTSLAPSDALRFRREARQSIVIACWMRQRFPTELARWADKVFATGLGTYWRTGGVANESQQYVRSYLGAISPFVALEIVLAAFCVRLGLDEYLRTILHTLRPSRFSSDVRYRP